MVLPVNNPSKSYWIEAAESKLDEFQSPELPSETDVVIVGSGYTGAATAYWIHKFTEKNGTTPRMCMLEARNVCGGATGRNGGQLRPHAYSRYTPWSEKFSPEVAYDLIKHEMAHLPAFDKLLAEEGITEEVCFKLGETFDAAMSEEAWTRLKGAYDLMKKDHGEDGEVVRDCRLIEDPEGAEGFTQMIGCLAAVVHPAGQVWPYKFVHALLRIVLKTRHLKLYDHTPATHVSERDENGWITVKTPRGEIRTRVVMHATNRWASHLLPNFNKLISAGLSTLAAIKAPEGFIKHTGAQHWDSVVNNYHLQLPPPYNTIIIGGAKQVLVHDPKSYINSDREDELIPGVPEFFQSWPQSDIVGWEGKDPAELGMEVEKGGCWTGVTSSSIDNFPFVGAIPDQPGHFIAAGYTGHGMPRILLSAAHTTPLILESLGVKFTPPSLVEPYPKLPGPYEITKERMDRLQNVDAGLKLENSVKKAEESAKKDFCNTSRCGPKSV
ncbi:FAD dependent oxidoreductase superfamily [Cadophora sp. DSE1049]|nr:FAD dependent oxidoreductase superfamily [Cadophora sp. DSE1049]